MKQKATQPQGKNADVEAATASNPVQPQVRRIGIELIGDVPWGTHFCQFYQTEQDLIDTLVPYFRAGLESNEFCMWITSEPLGVEEATRALQAAVPDLARRMQKGQIEILPYTEWYLLGGTFDQQRVLNGWVEKLNSATAKGYDGLRLSGNTFWLEKDDWNDFTQYEEAINNTIGSYPMIALCTYSLERCGAGEIADVVANHEFAFMKRHGKWTVIESSTTRLAKEALQEALAGVENLNEELRCEIEERTRIEEALRESERRVRLKLDSILSPQGDIGNLELEDIIDAPSVQSLMESFYQLAHIPMAMIDVKGKVLVGVGWQDICTEFHRVHPETHAFCIESDTELTLGVGPGESRLYRCKNNMWDIATPIIIAGEHMGNLFSGQFFFSDEPIDYGFFRSQARKYGFDETAYMKALDKVPRLSRATLDSAMDFFIKLADTLSQLSHSNIKLARMITQRERAEEALRNTNQRLALLSQTASLLLATDNPQGAVQLMCEQIMVHLDCQAFFNYLADSEAGRLHLNAFAGIPSEVGKSIEWLDYGVAVCGCAARDGCRIVAEDIPNTPDPRTELVKSMGIQAYACHPLVGFDGQVIGTLSFGTKTRKSFSKDDLGLMKTVADQVATAMERIRLQKDAESRAERDHYIAEMLQQALVPPDVPKQIGDWQIGKTYRSALSESEIGGDFYDVFDLGDGRLGLLIGDVAGKGLRAAIRVAAARYSVRSYAYMNPQPSQVLTFANDALCRDCGDESGILTAFFAVVETSSGRVAYSSAGHEPPLVCRATGEIVELETGGLPIGVLGSSTYTEGSVELAPGDTIVMVTDGVTEARASGCRMFEKRGMIQYLSGNSDASPDETAVGLLDAARAHAGGRLQDDVAILIVRNARQGGGARECPKAH